MVKGAFDDAYRRLFGRTIDGLAIEVANWSLTVATALKPIAKVTRLAGERKAPVSKTRHFFDAALRRTVEAAEVQRSDMLPGTRVIGPAIIVEDETSTIVTDAFEAIGQQDGSILLVRKDRANAQLRH
jgi:N-methylhydantoinase A